MYSNLPALQEIPKRMEGISNYFFLLKIQLQNYVSQRVVSYREETVGAQASTRSAGRRPSQEQTLVNADLFNS